ncbi:MAG: GNAT family N-acetyltransferase [Anaerolineae bacterium]|nr:GNAT family N-acetyltransferase [Anaerolineae bacterium]
MTNIHRIAQPTPALVDGLCQVLIDSVNGGASVGFLAPLSHDKALHYWQGVFAALGPDLVLWVAEDDEQVLGAVQLSLCQKENGQHRAEVQKLFVHRQARGSGIASRLMQTLEDYAKQERRSLLVLDTDAGSNAEKLYQKLGYLRIGEIPQYALSPDGTLHGTAYYYKILA